jgi:F0F1-type ATP synthase assembly protein I
MTISRARHITSMALGVFGACLVSKVETGTAALMGGLFLGLGLGVGSIRRRGSRR